MKRRPTPMLKIWYYLTDIGTRHFETKKEADAALSSDRSAITEARSHVFWDKRDLLTFFNEHVNI